MASYNTSDFKKGIKVQIDGEPYQMTECMFVKPGKGNALYKCKLKNLIRNTQLERTYKGGDSLEAADVSEIEAQYLYRQGDNYVFMDNTSYEQYEIPSASLDESARFLKEGMACSMLLFNNKPITVEPPKQVVLRVEYAEPGARGDTATKVTKVVTVETGASVTVPSFINQGELIKVDTRTAEYLERVRE